MTTPMKLSALVMRFTKLCSMAKETLSASLVKRLISSPWGWASKYFSGLLSSASNKSARRPLTALCAMRAVRMPEQ